MHRCLHLYYNDGVVTSCIISVGAWIVPNAAVTTAPLLYATESGCDNRTYKIA